MNSIFEKQIETFNISSFRPKGASCVSPGHRPGNLVHSYQSPERAALTRCVFFACPLRLRHGNWLLIIVGCRGGCLVVDERQVHPENTAFS